MEGWVRLGRVNSGPDKRSSEGYRPGRLKTVWGWSADPAAMAAARLAERRAGDVAVAA